MNKFDIKYMKLALEKAKQAQKQGEVPVGAVCVLDGKVISSGKNELITKLDPTAHAEIIALRNAGKYLNNYRLLNVTLYVTLEPCVMCVGAMVHSRIKRVVYGASDFKTGACGSKFDLLKKGLHNHIIVIESGVLEKECSAILSNFFKKRRLEKKNI